MKENCQIGVGLRPPHYSYLQQKPQTVIKWFEVITENFMDSLGRPMEILEFMRADYPIAIHGVSLSVGSTEGINNLYLKKLKNLIQRINPFLVSDHLCFTGLQNKNLHNLLPVIYNKSSLDLIVSQVDYVQNFLQRTIALENLSAYFGYQDSTFSEWDFLREVAQRSGCKILLDINNIYVNSINQKFDPHLYLDNIPASLIAEIHLAGFSDRGDFLFDTHSQPVFPKVWDLLRYKIADYKNIPLLIEWDEDIPEFSVLENEALKAKKIWEEKHGG